jgi:hypothetical protein
VLREPDDISRQARTLPGLTTDEKLSYWNTEGSDSPDLRVENLSEPRLILEERADPNTLVTVTWTILIQSKAYQWLVGRIQRILTTREGATMEFIRKVILGRLNVSNPPSDGIYSADYLISWRPLEFLREQNYQKGENQAIGEIITVTGSAIDAQAMTCAQYMNQTWPLSGNETLGALQAAIASPFHRHHCICSYPGFVNPFEY